MFTDGWKHLSHSEKIARLRSINGLNAQWTTPAVLTAVASLLDDVTEKAETDASTKAYQDFLLTEFSNIASAHFHADANITRFFQFYLIIIGLPVTIFGALLRYLPTPSTGEDAWGIDALLSSEYGIFLGLGASVVGLIGLFMLGYVANVRMDSLQYARVVNGIRSYFVGRSGLDPVSELGTRVLPRSIHQPRYTQWRYFGFVVAAFAVLDTFYFLLATWLLAPFLGWWSASSWEPYATAAALGLLIHGSLYQLLARYRERHYLRGYVIGVDIDGVLNDHRRHFCRVLQRETGKEVDPNSITRIPVHECRDLVDVNGDSLDVTLDDEMLVFNCVDYWSDMPPVPDASRTLREFKETLHYKVMVFTHRPWPNPADYHNACKNNAVWTTQEKCDKRKAFRTDWENSAYLSSTSPAFDTDLKILRRFEERFLEWRRAAAQRKLTRTWLNTHELAGDRLYIERGNVHVPDPRSRNRNRFTISQKKQIRVFIEDDLRKALKLSSVCEFVYLISHPYNVHEDLPSNVFRCDSLKDVMRHIRDHL